MKELSKKQIKLAQWVAVRFQETAFKVPNVVFSATNSKSKQIEIQWLQYPNV